MPGLQLVGKHLADLAYLWLDQIASWFHQRLLLLMCQDRSLAHHLQVQSSDLTSSQHVNLYVGMFVPSSGQQKKSHT